MARRVYVGIVEGDRKTGYSMFFPDVLGCVTAADTLDELAARAKEALEFHFEGLFEDGVAPPPASALDDIQVDADVVEAGRMLVEVDVADGPVRVNVSIPSSLLGRIDREAQSRGMTRSAFLAEGAKALLKTG